MKKRSFYLCLVLVLLLGLVGCSGGPAASGDYGIDGDKITTSTGTRDLTEAEKKHGVLYKGEPYTLRIDLNTLMPSEDTSNPSANKAAKLIADEFTAMFPNVSVEWDRTKGDDWSYWMTTQLAAEAAPDICFMQGSQYADRGWFVPLNTYLDEINPFVENAATWKEMFPNYVWENYLCTDAANNIVAVPLTLYPSTANTQDKHAAKLFALERQGTSTTGGVVVGDMTAIHSYMLQSKRFIDMTANNINHPNDFLVREYAQMVCTMLIK